MKQKITKCNQERQKLYREIGELSMLITPAAVEKNIELQKKHEPQKQKQESSSTRSR